VQPLTGFQFPDRARPQAGKMSDNSSFFAAEHAATPPAFD